MIERFVNSHTFQKLSKPFKGALTSVLAGPKTFPQLLPVSHIRIGTFSIAAFPAEMSTATGMEVRQTLLGTLPNTSHGVFEIIGLANEYTGYVASSYEYASQDYMAASTLWGPYEADAFACQLKMK